MFIENYEGLTACDLAVRENLHDIALFLESRMVFNSTPEDLGSSEATLSASGSLGRSSFEVTEDEARNNREAATRKEMYRKVHNLKKLL